MHVTAADLVPILASNVISYPICHVSVYINLALPSHPSRWTPPSQCTLMTGSKPARTHVHFKIASHDDRVHPTLHVKACVDPPLDAFVLFAPLVTPQRALLRRCMGTSILDELFWHTVAYEPHCQGLGCMWVVEDK